jgi:hypothetical protein
MIAGAPKVPKKFSQSKINTWARRTIPGFKRTEPGFSSSAFPQPNWRWTMSEHTGINRGEIALQALRFSLLAATAALVGVLGHVAWKIISA